MKCVIAWTMPITKSPQNPLLQNGKDDKSLWFGALTLSQ